MTAGLELDAERAEVRLDGTSVLRLHRSRRMWTLVERIATRGEMDDRAALYSAVWERPYAGRQSDLALNVAIKRLRAKLADTQISVEPTQRGGFVLVGPDGTCLCWLDQPEPDASSSCPHNLGGRVESFVGRAKECRVLADLLGADTQLVTLSGSAGCGKTRLAREVARTIALGPAAPIGGVWFCDLTVEDTAQGAWVAIARVLGDATFSAQTAESALDEMGRMLHHRGDMLLVLDNFEQLAPVAEATIAGLLQRAPRLCCLVTSRVLLRVDGETSMELGPLQTAAAAALFLERGRQVRADFDATACDPTIIAEIVTLLDGMPLAIELAASWCRMLAPRQILARLTDRFQLLRAQRTSGPVHHVSLSAALDWSWELLDDVERHALARCAVFRGGFDLAAAQAVVAAAVTDSDRTVSDVVAALRDRSLLHAEGDGPERLGMYLSVREHAEQRGAELYAIFDAEQAHAVWYAECGEVWSREIHSAMPRPALQALQREYDNLVTANIRMLDQAPNLSVQIALSLDELYRVRGPDSVRSMVLERTADAAVGCDPEILVPALCARARVRTDVGDLSGAAEDVGQGLALTVHLDGEEQRARLLLVRAGLARVEGRIVDMFDDQAACLELADVQKVPRLHALLLNDMAVSRSMRSRSDLCFDQRWEAVGILQEHPDLLLEGQVRGNLGISLCWFGRYSEAVEQLEFALECFRRVGCPREEGIVLAALCGVRFDEQKWTLAAELGAEAMELHRRTGNRQWEGMSILDLGDLAWGQGQTPRAIAHYREGIAILQECGMLIYAGLGRAFLAAMLASGDDLASARSEWARSREVMGQETEWSRRVVRDLLLGHLELATARAVATGAEPPGAELPSQPDAAVAQLRSNALARWCAAHSVADEAGTGHPTSPVAEFSDVRFAARMLRRALEVDEVPIPD